MDFQYSHGQMHNYLGFSMRDGSFSIINPLFIVYHSYIDYMLELKIRLVNEDQNKEAYQSLKRFTSQPFTNKYRRHNEDVRTIL